jgi:hypothetical protein
VKYPKIQSLYKRDPKTKYKTFLRDYSLPEFGILQDVQWAWKEKLDGTNIRLEWRETAPGSRHSRHAMTIAGRTDRAQIPADLTMNILQDVDPNALREVFGERSTTLFGEGVGAGIQKGGGNYGQRKHFVLFDIYDGRWWLPDEIEDVAVTLGVDFAPVVARCTPLQMADAIRLGAVTGNNMQSTFGDFPSEGVVGVPDGGMLRFNGDRIITKLKTKDFQHDLAIS